MCIPVALSFTLKNLDYDVDLVLPVKLLEVDLHVWPLYDHCSVKSLSWMRYNMSKSIVFLSLGTGNQRFALFFCPP